MERHRCTHCRNPIRNVAVACDGDEDRWYHPDCWDVVCASEQERYQRAVREDGLSALLAPYVSSGPVRPPVEGGTVTGAGASAAQRRRPA